MIKIPVYLRDMCDAKHLVQAASGCEKNVDLIQCHLVNWNMNEITPLEIRY